MIEEKMEKMIEAKIKSGASTPDEEYWLKFGRPLGHEPPEGMFPAYDEAKRGDMTMTSERKKALELARSELFKAEDRAQAAGTHCEEAAKVLKSVGLYDMANKASEEAGCACGGARDTVSIVSGEIDKMLQRHAAQQEESNPVKKCDRCAEPITGYAVKSGGRHFHEWCKD